MRCRRLKIWSLVLLGAGGFAGVQAQPGDTLQLSVEQLFELGVANSLVLQADVLQEEVAGLQQRTARADRLPDLNVGLQGAYVGQPVIFRRGLSDPYHPDVPRWSQNYAVDVSQKIYSGGRVKYTVRKAELEASLAALQTGGDRSAVKLSLMGQYLELFNLYRQEQVLNRNIEESERRLQDIRRMKREGLITTNDVLRSEMQLTDDQLALQQTRNNLRIAQETKTEVLRQLRTAVEQSVLDRRGYAKETIQMQKKVKSDALAYQVTSRKYEEGLMSPIDVRTSSATLLTSRADLLQKKLMYIIKCKLVDYYKGKPLY